MVLVLRDMGLRVGVFNSIIWLIGLMVDRLDGR